MKRIILYIETLMIAIQYKYHNLNKKSAHIVWMKSLKDYIVFCPECGEYICYDGYCSNPVCPEKINDEE